jgi:hypothetical protein
VVNCFAGCKATDILAAVDLDLSDLFPDNVVPIQQKEESVSLETLSIRTAIPEERLSEYGLEDSGSCVVVPYYDEEKRFLHKKYRTALSGKNKYRYERGVKSIPYGLWRLVEAISVGALVIVEGESDCWTLWSFDIPALGIPGASNFRVLKSEHLRGLKKIFVVQEPDKAGEQFVIGLCDHFQELGFSGSVRVVKMSDDPNEMYKRDPNRFREDFIKLCERAKSFSSESIEDLVVNLAEVTIEDVEFMWDPYVPYRHLSLLAGKPGMGKSMMATAVSAGLSQGWKLPGDLASRDPVSCLLFSAEDDLARVTVPRLKDCGADLGNIYAFDAAHNDFKFEESGFQRLEMLIERLGVRFVVFDPLVAFMPFKLDINRSNEVRSILAPLAQIAERRDVAMMIVAHVRKGHTETAIDAIVGSVDFSAAVRSVMLMYEDPDLANARVVAHAKHNFSAPGRTLRFEVKDGMFLWDNEGCDLGADVLARTAALGDEKEAVSEAMRFLRLELTEERLVSEVQKRARQLGLTPLLIRKACSRLGIKAKKKGFGNKRDFWYPSLSEEVESEPIHHGSATELEVPI